MSESSTWNAEVPPAVRRQVNEASDECQRLLRLLGDGELRAVALLRMEGYTVGEIAARLKCRPRSVRRKLQLIRSIWEGEVAP